MSTISPDPVADPPAAGRPAAGDSAGRPIFPSEILNFDDQPVITEPFALGAGVFGVFTRRWGGVSAGEFGGCNLSDGVGDDQAAVAENRARVLAALGPGRSRIGWMRQVHGADVAYVPGGGPGTAAAPEVDAVFTDSPEVALAALVADCVPVLVADPVAGLIGAAHAGRPGMVAGVVPALLARMTAAGAAAARMRAVVGPSVCGRCYEVPDWMAREVDAAVPGTACRTRAGTAGVDLRAGVRAQLAAAGVGQIADDPRCTLESPELYSYRRDGRTGRFAGVIWLAG